MKEVKNTQPADSEISNDEKKRRKKIINKFISVLGILGMIIGIYSLGHVIGENSGITDTSNNFEKILLTQVKEQTKESDSLNKNIVLLELKLSDTVSFFNNKIQSLSDSNKVLQDIIIKQKQKITQYLKEKETLLAQIEILKYKPNEYDHAYIQKVNEVNKIDSILKHTNDSITESNKEIKKNNEEINKLNIVKESNEDKDKRIEEGMKYFELGLRYELEGDRVGIFRGLNKRISSYEESIKNYKLAVEYGISRSKDKVQVVKNKKDEIDKDNIVSQ